MRIPLLAIPYKVTPTPTKWTEGWAGWRLWTWGLYVAHPCACAGADHHGEACPCENRDLHRHTFFGAGSRPIFAPNIVKPGRNRDGQ